MPAAELPGAGLWFHELACLDLTDWDGVAVVGEVVAENSSERGESTEGSGLGHARLSRWVREASRQAEAGRHTRAHRSLHRGDHH